MLRNSNDNDDDANLPPPQHDPNLSDSMREQQRRDRLAAAEARMKKHQTGKTKSKNASGAPLRGPNSEPLMRWNAG